MLEASPDSLESWCDEFPILHRSTYMISNSLGAMPRGVALSCLKPEGRRRKIVCSAVEVTSSRVT